MGIFPIGVLFYWIAIFIGFIIIVTTFKNAFLNLFFAFFIIIFSSLNVLTDNSFIFFLSVLSKSAVLILVSTITIIEFPKMLKWQIFIFLVLSVPIMIIQISGVSETVHVLNTLFYQYDEFGGSYRDLQLEEVLFKKSEEIIYNSAQSRPPGLFHSNAILSPILLSSAAILFSLNYSKKLAITDLLICLSLVLVMSKISVVAIFVILLISKNNFDSRIRYWQIFILLLMLYFTYWIFIPGYFVNNLGLDGFYSSSYYRLIDMYLYINTDPDVHDELIRLSSELSFNYMDQSDIGGLSGIAKIIKYLPIFMITAFIFRKRIFLKYRDLKAFSPKLFTLSKLSMVTLIICSFATPLFKSPIFGYFAGFALLPFLYPIIKHKFETSNVVS
jgi:hypothetical protein